MAVARETLSRCAGGVTGHAEPGKFGGAGEAGVLLPLSCVVSDSQLPSFADVIVAIPACDRAAVAVAYFDALTARENRFAEQVRAAQGSFVSDVASYEAASSLHSQVSPGSSVSSSRAQRRARWRAARAARRAREREKQKSECVDSGGKDGGAVKEKARGAGLVLKPSPSASQASVDSGFPRVGPRSGVSSMWLDWWDDDSEGSDGCQVAGNFSYLRLFKHDVRSQLEGELGPAPTFRELLKVPAGYWASMATLAVQPVTVGGGYVRLLGPDDSGVRRDTFFLTLLRSAEASTMEASLARAVGIFPRAQAQCLLVDRKLRVGNPLS